MNFSLILPTRGRQFLMSTLLETIKVTTNRIEEVELLVAVDNDDEETLKRLPQWKVLYPFTTFYQLQRATNFSVDYYNYLAKLAKGDFIIALNDDIEFRTKNWDWIINSKLQQYFHPTRADKICYGWLDDGYRHPQGFCCFPLLTRQAYEVLGYFFPEELPTWGADCELFYIFRNLDRVCKIPEVLLQHISPHTGFREADAQNHRVQELDRRQKFDLRNDVSKLRRHIRRFR